MFINHGPVIILTNFEARSTQVIHAETYQNAIEGETLRNGQMDRIFMILKMKLTHELFWPYHGTIYLCITR